MPGLKTVPALVLALTLAANCSAAPGLPTASPAPTAQPERTPGRPAALRATPTAISTRPSPPSATATATATATPTATPTVTPTPHPLAWATIAKLRAREYGGSGIRVVGVLEERPSFTRQLIEFPSDGLTVRGFMNVPRGEGPFPVVVVTHGYVNPAAYRTLAYTTRYADAYAEAGFLVLHPDLRGHGQSDPGPNAFRAGYAIDVLNLLHQLDSLPQADPGRVALWGHSMGGGITIKLLTLSDRVAAAVLYGSMSADEAANYQRIVQVFTGGAAAGSESLPLAPEQAPELYERISAINHLEAVSAPLQLHHGAQDGEVPPDWSVDLHRRLQALDRPSELFLYEGQGHSLQGAAYELFNRRVIDFLRRELGP